MRYEPPMDPCDEPLCMTLATQEIVREQPGRKSEVVALSCEWHVQALWRDQVAQHMERADQHTVVGYYIQRHLHHQ